MGEGVILNVSTLGYFEQSATIELMSTNFTLESLEGHMQYNFNPIMYFYRNGDMATKEVGYYYFDQCTASADIVFEF